jgi:ADP-heptose:LPS heptosyltransferase
MNDAADHKMKANPPLEGRRGLAITDDEAAAQGCFVVMTAGKRRATRLLEKLLYPVVRVWELLCQRPNDVSNVIREILVVEYSLLGDIVLLLPFLKNLRGLYPTARITLLVNRSAVALLKHEDLADELVCARMPWVEYSSRLRKWNPFSSMWLALWSRLLYLRRKQIDLAFSVRGDIRDNFLLWMTRAKRRVGYAFGGGAFLLTDAVQPDVAHTHISERWLKFLEYLGKPILERHPHLRLASSEEEFANQYLAEQGIQPGDLVVGIHPKARVPTRRWSEANFRAIADRLSGQFPLKILWFSDPQDVSQIARNRSGMVPVCLPLREFMAVLSRCKLLICNDGGQMHIATALQVPVVAVFGSTEPAWYAPMGARNRVIIQTGFWCRPCGERCVFDKPYCIQSISIEQVWESAAELIRSFLSGDSSVAIDDRERRLASSLGSRV